MFTTLSRAMCSTEHVLSDTEVRTIPLEQTLCLIYAPGRNCSYGIKCTRLSATEFFCAIPIGRATK